MTAERRRRKARKPLTPRTLQILLSLAEAPRHGYGIKLDIEARSEGRIKLGAGTLYEAIQRLESSGWIEEVDTPGNADTPAGPPRRFYGMTAAGGAALREELQSLRDIVDYAEANALFSR